MGSMATNRHLTQKRQKSVPRERRYRAMAFPGEALHYHQQSTFMVLLTTMEAKQFITHEKDPK